MDRGFQLQTLYMQCDIAAAVATLKKSMQVCDRFRRKTSIISSLGRSKNNYDDHTDGKNAHNV